MNILRFIALLYKENPTFPKNTTTKIDITIPFDPEIIEWVKSAYKREDLQCLPHSPR